MKIRHSIYITIALFIVGCSSVKNSAVKNENSIKKEVLKTYSIYEEEKDELLNHLEIGFDREENQTYYISHLLHKADTIRNFPKYRVKNKKNKTCYYSEGSKPIVCKEKIGDITKIYSAPDLTIPSKYEIYDDKELIATIAKNDDNESDFQFIKTFVSQRTFDLNGNMIYYVETPYYLPKNFDPEKKENLFISRNNLERSDWGTITEKKYEYY
jgi:hypothetical protein